MPRRLPRRHSGLRAKVRRVSSHVEQILVSAQGSYQYREGDLIVISGMKIPPIAPGRAYSTLRGSSGNIAGKSARKASLLSRHSARVETVFV
jgi:hypothetical protein